MTITAIEIQNPCMSSGAGKHIAAAILGTEPPQQAMDQAQKDAITAIETAGGKVDADGTLRS